MNCIAVRSIGWMALLIAWSAGQVASAQGVSFGSLLQAIPDRERMAIHPEGHYTLHQASSRDPRDPGRTPLGAPAGFGNVDWSNFLRRETISGRQEWVLMDQTGPGALTRMWLAGFPEQGNLRIYVDGADQPVLAGPANQVLGNNGALFGTSLSFHSANPTDGVNRSGHNLYAPIPYQQRVKVTWDGPNPHGAPGPGGVAPLPPTASNPNINGGLWWNVNYAQYQPGTAVASYASGAPAANQAQLTQTNQALKTLAPTGPAPNNFAVADAPLANGQSLSHDLNGGGAIRRLKVNVAGANQTAALRNTFIELTFDGQRTARVPIGHFFGNGDSRFAFDAYNDFQDHYRKVQANGDMSSYFVMPYQSGAQVRIVNESGQPVQVDLEIDSGDWQWNERSMHFHSNFVEEKTIRTRSAGGDNQFPANANGDADFNFVTIRGKGVYVGDTLSIRNGTAGWWGEGDEKIYVDKESFPSHYGTGTEDYYGYAHSHGGTFGSPFVGQSNGDANPSPSGSLRAVNSRVRGGADAIPFNNALKFDMEVWAWNPGSVDFGATTYWYGTPGSVALKTVADLAVNYKTAVNGQTSQQAAIADTSGDGQWLYFRTSNANPSQQGASAEMLTYGVVGLAGASGYGGGQSGANLPAISNRFLFPSGAENIGIGGVPGYHELAISPAGTIPGNPRQGGGGPTDGSPYLVARWVAGDSSVGLANISGSIRNFVDLGNSVEFYIYVNGMLKFSAIGGQPESDHLLETYFDFDAALPQDSIVDFVLGNRGGSAQSDESLLRAIIKMADTVVPVPEPGSAALGLLGCLVWRLLTRRAESLSVVP